MKRSIQSLKQRMTAGEPCFGLYISTPGQMTVEAVSMAGYDFIRIDCEHGLLGKGEVRELIRTANLLELPVFVRVSGLSEIPAVLDAGADGVIVPDIDSAEAAKAAVAATKYAPLGRRGLISTMRNMGYSSIPSTEYVKTANEDILLCIQIEDKSAVKQLDDIFSVEGIDMVATGKQDLSQSYGCPGDTTNPRVQEAQDKVIRKGLEYGRFPAILVSNRKKMEELREMGVACFLVGFDSTIIRSALEEHLEAFK